MEDSSQVSNFGSLTRGLVRLCSVISAQFNREERLLELGIHTPYSVQSLGKGTASAPLLCNSTS